MGWFIGGFVIGLLCGGLIAVFGFLIARSVGHQDATHWTEGLLENCFCGFFWLLWR